VIDVQKIHDRDLVSEVNPVIRQAGAIVRSYFGKTLKKTDKRDGSFMTEADIASEKFLLPKLQEIVPQATILAEESGEHGPGNRGLRWVVDPIDGTTNFAHGFPYFSISVGLTLDDEPIFGAIYNPVLDELFYAQKGKGAFCNGSPIHVSSRTTLSDLVISVGISARCRLKDLGGFWDRFENVACQIRTFRKLGSAALDMAHVAAGRLDAAFFGDLSWWDIAAGIVIVKEAGGVIRDIDSREVRPGFTESFASNSQISRPLIDLLKKKVENR
jgi:myo-inositol-1(or 4)-monophosphatase